MIDDDDFVETMIACSDDLSEQLKTIVAVCEDSKVVHLVAFNIAQVKEVLGDLYDIKKTELILKYGKSRFDQVHFKGWRNDPR